MTRPFAFALAAAFAVACSEDRSVPPAPVDATPPTVVSRHPAAGDSNAFAGEGFRAEFSERLDRATVSASTVRVLRGETVLPAEISLSKDGRTILIRPEALAFPESLTIALGGGIADLAGNTFAGDGEPWAFTLPRWVDLGAGAPIFAEGGPNPTPSVAVDDSGAVLAALGNTQAPVGRWPEGGVGSDTGAPWVSISGRVVQGPAGEVWLTDRSGPLRWTGTGWVRVGPAIEVAEGYPWHAHVVPGAEPLQVWNQCRLIGPEECEISVQVRALVGGAWESRGAIAASYPYIDVAGGGGAAYVVASNGGRYAVFALEAEGPRALPAPLEIDVPIAAGLPGVAVGGDGLPVVALAQPDVGLVVRRFDGAGWTPVGAPLSAGARPRAAAVALDADGEVVVAWTETEGAWPGSPQLVHVARHGPGGWELLGGPLNLDPARDAFDVALALDAAGAPVVVWPEATGETALDVSGNAYAIYAGRAKRLNR